MPCPCGNFCDCTEMCCCNRTCPCLECRQLRAQYEVKYVQEYEDFCTAYKRVSSIMERKPNKRLGRPPNDFISKVPEGGVFVMDDVTESSPEQGSSATSDPGSSATSDTGSSATSDPGSSATSDPGSSATSDPASYASARLTDPIYTNKYFATSTHLEDQMIIRSNSGASSTSTVQPNRNIPTFTSKDRDRSKFSDSASGSRKASVKESGKTVYKVSTASKVSSPRRNDNVPKAEIGESEAKINLPNRSDASDKRIDGQLPKPAEAQNLHSRSDDESLSVMETEQRTAESDGKTDISSHSGEESDGIEVIPEDEECLGGVKFAPNESSLTCTMQ